MYNWYLEYLKNYEPKKVVSASGVKLRKVLHPAIYAFAPMTTKNKLRIVRKEPLPKERPIIFACTHGFKDDILFSVMMAKIHAYVLIGGLGHFYNTMDGVTLWLNGTVIVDRQDKASRRAAVQKMIRAISLGANMIIFPEGLWNKTENLLVQKLFPGIYDVAKATGAKVVPIVTHLDGTTCYAIRDKEFDLTSFDRAEGMAALRDKFASLRWEIMETYCTTTRDELLQGILPEKYWFDYIEAMIAETAFYEKDDEAASLYRDKTIVTPEDAFAHLDNLIPCGENIFLWNKR